MTFKIVISEMGGILATAAPRRAVSEVLLWIEINGLPMSPTFFYAMTVPHRKKKLAKRKQLFVCDTYTYPFFSLLFLRQWMNVIDYFYKSTAGQAKDRR